MIHKKVFYNAFHVTHINISIIINSWYIWTDIEILIQIKSFDSNIRYLDDVKNTKISTMQSKKICEY